MKDKIKQFATHKKLRRFSFLQRHLRQHTENSRIAKWLAVGLGAVFLVMGLVMLVFPGPGLLFIVLGLSCFSLLFPALARYLDKGEIKIRRWFKKPRA